MTKLCKKCKEQKPLTPEYWYFRKGAPRCPCKECLRKKQIQYYYQLDKKEPMYLLSKRCSKCGEIKNPSEFNKSREKNDGLRTYCKLCQRKYDKGYGRGKRKSSQAGKLDSKFRRHLSGYKSGARTRGFDWKLSDQEALKMFLGDCFYCGAPPAPAPSGRTPRNGIDRLNSSLGYFSSNCVSCCTTCNLFKRDRGSQEFIELIDSIHKNLARKGLIS